MRKTALLLLILPLLFTACRSSKSIQNRFYVLELPASIHEKMPEHFSPLPGSYFVQPVEVAPAYASYQIALREESHSIRYFSFNEWAERPANALTAMVKSFLNANRVFEETLTGRQTERADYFMRIRVSKMEADHQAVDFEARLVVELSLTDARTGEVLHHHLADRSSLLPERNLNLFAAAISELFAEELASFALRMLQIRADNREY